MLEAAAGTLAAAALAATALAAETFREARAHATPARLEVAARLGAVPQGPVACEALPVWAVVDSVVPAVASVVEAVVAECAAGECGEVAVVEGSEKKC